MLLLDLLPAWSLGFRCGWLGERQGRVDAELPVMRRPILCGLEFDVPGTAEYLLQDGHNRSEVIVCQMPAKPTNEIH